MEIIEAIRAALKELVLPEIDKIKEDNVKIKTILEANNKRLDDINTHLVAQSHRIDAVRKELTQRIDETNKRIDETNKRIDETNRRIDGVREELTQGIAETNRRIDGVREELTQGILETNKRVEQMGNRFDDRMNRLYEVIVRRDEMNRLEQEVYEIKQKLAA